MSSPALPPPPPRVMMTLLPVSSNAIVRSWSPLDLVLGMAQLRWSVLFLCVYVIDSQIGRAGRALRQPRPISLGADSGTEARSREGTCVLHHSAKLEVEGWTPAALSSVHYLPCLWTSPVNPHAAAGEVRDLLFWRRRNDSSLSLQSDG